jgi:hypothetical protein
MCCGQRSARALRANLIHLIVRSLLDKPEAPLVPAPAALAGALPTQPAPKRRFDDVQLAHRQEIISTVDCECPNQVEDLLPALNAFENYSRDSKNRNADDAKIHAMLARATGHARALMETAMTGLCTFEKIDIEHLAHRQNTSLPLSDRYRSDRTESGSLVDGQNWIPSGFATRSHPQVNLIPHFSRPRFTCATARTESSPGPTQRVCPTR